MSSIMPPNDSSRNLHTGLNPVIGDTQALSFERQTEFVTLNNCFNEIEGGFHNLAETVPPHAQDWWQESDPARQAKLQGVRAELNALSHDLAGLLSLRSPKIVELLADLEGDLSKARVELGSRTAAGRAKAS